MLVAVVFLVVVLELVVGGLVDRSRRTNPAVPDSWLFEPQPVVEARVVGVIDGDTLLVEFGAFRGRVRLTGLNAPEWSPLADRREPWAKEARQAARARIPDRVWLEHDWVVQDHYNRRLAYVWLEPPQDHSLVEIRSNMLNAVLLLEGYAKPLAVPPNVRYADLFEELAREAREVGKGLWGP